MNPSPSSTASPPTSAQHSSLPPALGSLSAALAASEPPHDSQPPEAAPQTVSQTVPEAAPSAPSLGSILDGDTRAVVIAIPASSEFVRVVRLAVAGVATRMRFSYEQIEDIKLAVSEACNNAILHAEPPGGGAPTQVVVRMLPGAGRLEITVFDQGFVPDPGQEMPRSGAGAKGLDDLPEGGMGLLVIQALMDEVSSHTGSPGHTALHMVKLIRPL